MALYTLSLAYGIEASGVGWSWHVFAMLPPVTTLFILLPLLCRSLSLFEAYAVPNAAVLDNVISDTSQRTADMEYLRQQLAHRIEQSQNGALGMLLTTLASHPPSPIHSVVHTRPFTHYNSVTDLSDMMHGKANASTLVFRLRKFETNFDSTHGPIQRRWQAFQDLARGQALCFIDRKACFLAGVLKIA